MRHRLNGNADTKGVSMLRAATTKFNGRPKGKSPGSPSADVIKKRMQDSLKRGRATLPKRIEKED